MPLSARELHQRGVDAANARRYAYARRVLTTAAGRSADSELLARIEGTLAYVLAQVGQPAEAERLSRAALAREHLSPETVALVSGQLGTLLMHAGRLDEADDMLTRALEELDDSTIESANCRMSRSMVNMQRHRLDQSVDDLQRAIEVYANHGAEVPLAEARHNLGYAALLRGDLVTALELMSRSRPTLAAVGDLPAAISDLDRAEVLRDAGLTSEAEALLGEVAVRFGSQRMRQARGEAEFHLARSLLRHDAGAAERVASTAVRRFTALGSEGWAARAEAVRLSARMRARPKARFDADSFAGASAALARGGFHTEAAALTLTARLADGGRLPRVAADTPTPLRLRAHEVRAARAVNASRFALARRIAAEGLDLLTVWQRSFGALDLQISVAMHGTDLMYTGLAAAARTRDPRVLFEWSERARHLSQQVTPVRPPLDETLAGELAELRMLRAELAGSDWTTDARVRTLRDRVRQRQWSSTGGGVQRERFDLEDVRSRLDGDTAVLAYVYTGTELLCVAVSASDSTIVRLSWLRVREALDGLRADLDMAALTRGGPMGQLVARALDDRLRVLDRELLSPVLAVLGSSNRLVLTVPGVLAGIPWAMLPGMTGRPFTLATSISRWLGESAHPRRVLTSAGFAAGPRVARAEEEVRRAAAAWSDGSVVVGEEARVAEITELAGRSDVLHIAAHGRHAADNPLFSGFELIDGTLFGYDVDLIARAPELVVLSACELGRSSVRWGEEALGMTRVWLHAGTRCVISAPVAVPDDIACELLGAVHTQLADGIEPAVALAAVSASPEMRTPFQCHGNGF